ncbi:MAG: hypothetical protein ACRDRD_18760, partial [Pseudonocardiaceae bacterium]
MASSPTDLASRPQAAPSTGTPPREEHLEAASPGGPRDSWSISSVLDLLPTLPNWPGTRNYGHRARISEGARTVLDWLNRHPGQGWQQRWHISGADQGLDWIDDLISDSDSRSPRTQRESLIAGMSSLLLCRIVMPGYPFLNGFGSGGLFRHAQQVFRPDLFAELGAKADQVEFGGYRRNLA